MIPRISTSIVRRFAPAMVAVTLLQQVATAQTEAGSTLTQTFPLRAGWNAIWIRVEPEDRRPAAVFTNLPVDRVATYFPSRTPVDYIQDPGALPFKQKGWNVWYAPQLPEAVATDLYAILGGQCYLVHATAAATLNVRGSAIHRRVAWRADSFNFVGFTVDPASPPTFGAWFAGSKAHQSGTRPVVYRLDAASHWQPVSRQDQTLIEPNVAYWVYCAGASDYQGPLDVKLPGGVAANFGAATEKMTIQIANGSPLPNPVMIQSLRPSELSLSYVDQDISAGVTRFPLLDEPYSFGTLEAGESRNLRLVVRREKLTGTNQATLMQIRDGVGSQILVPVKSELAQ